MFLPKREIALQGRMRRKIVQRRISKHGRGLSSNDVRQVRIGLYPALVRKEILGLFQGGQPGGQGPAEIGVAAILVASPGNQAKGDNELRPGGKDGPAASQIEPPAGVRVGLSRHQFRVPGPPGVGQFQQPGRFVFDCQVIGRNVGRAGLGTCFGGIAVGWRLQFGRFPVQ